jgi:arylsulfatase
MWFLSWRTILAGAIGVPTAGKSQHQKSMRWPQEDTSAFMLGKNTTSGRDTFMFFGPDGELMSVKWHTVKVIFRYTEGIDKAIVKPYVPMLFDLSSDPHENVNLWEYNMETGWMFAPALKAIAEYQKSIEKYPNIRTGQEFNGYKQ